MTAKSTQREERLAAALRENLKRRKARDRAQAKEPEPDRAERPKKAPKTD